MLDIGWPELFVLIVVALIVVGPKDLPKMLYNLGKWARKARSLSRDFQRGVDKMVREAELDELRDQAQSLRKTNIKREVEKAVDPSGSLKDAFDVEGGDSRRTTAADATGDGQTAQHSVNASDKSSAAARLGKAAGSRKAGRSAPPDGSADGGPVPAVASTSIADTPAQGAVAESGDGTDTHRSSNR